ncbi:MAG TPA: exo-alpha-sialidase, partial [Rheinheimera sp.]|nr:exo-alpha-sialidase [Rheinheimera sp.]
MLQLTQVRCIWQQAPHNAFTDLIDFNAALWCVFREGSTHVSDDGAFRILRSTDAVNWHSVALLQDSAADLRDAKLCQTPDGKLLLLGAGALHDRSSASHQSYLWQSADGTRWHRPQAVGEPNIWLWRMAWQQQQLYSLGYKVGQPRLVRLYQSSDNSNFNAVADVYTGSYANETGLLFEPDGTALCLLRRDPDNGLFGQSEPPYTNWHWQDIGCRIGGPQWLQLPDGRLLACVRLYDSDVRTSLCWIDRLSGKLTEAITLPSAGDCSYAGMVLRGNTLYVSYYSS